MEDDVEEAAKWIIHTDAHADRAAHRWTYQMMRVRKITASTSGICITIYFIGIIWKPFLPCTVYTRRLRAPHAQRMRRESGKKYERKGGMKKKNGNKSGLIGPIHGVNWSRHAYTIHASILCVCIYSPLSCVRYSFYGTIEKSPLGRSDIVNGVRATVVIVVDTYIILYRITNGRKTTV